MEEYAAFCESMRLMYSDDDLNKVLYDVHWQIYKMKKELDIIRKSLSSLESEEDK
jgi:hypothetical protein